MKIKNKLYIIPILIIIFLFSLKIFLVSNDFLGFNEAVYSYISGEINNGQLPYKDVFDHKPPLIYYTLALFFKIFGQSVQTLHVLALFFDLALLISIFLIAKKLYNTKLALYASALYFIFTTSIIYDTEIPMTLFGLIGIFLYLSFLKNRSKKYLFLFFSGFFLALSVWFKQPGVLFFVAIIIHQIYLIHKKDIKLKNLFKNLYFLIAGALIISIPLLSYFIYIIGFKTFFYHIITFNAKFAGSTSRILQIGKFFRLLIYNFGILLAIIFVFFKDLTKEKYPYKNRFLIFLSVIILLFFLVNKEIFLSHLIQLYPFLILLSISAYMSVKDEKIKLFITALFLIILLNSSLIVLESVARDIRDNAYAKKTDAFYQLNSEIPKNAEIFADSAIYYVLTNHKCHYKLCYFAPSTASVFDFSDFCDFSKQTNYLILTHRKKYLGKQNLNCIDADFELIRRFDKIDEQFVEIWKNKQI